MNYWTMPSQKDNVKTTKEMLNYAEKIIEKVSEYYKIQIKDIKGRSRKREFVKARFISMYLIRNNTSLKLKTIGDIVGRDHTTVLHSLQTIQNTLSLHYDTDLRDELNEIKRII
jgi:chromosomal replication initiator protein